MKKNILIFSLGIMCGFGAYFSYSSYWGKVHGQRFREDLAGFCRDFLAGK